MSQFLDLISKFQQVPTMSTGLSRAISRHGATRHQGQLDAFNASVSAAKANNAAVVGDLVSLTGESAGSALSSLGEFAQGALSDLFGGGAKSRPQASSGPNGATPEGVPSSLDGSAAAQTGTGHMVTAAAGKSLQATMGMGESYLGRGNAGPEVKTLQNNLAKLGYDVGEVDGKFGPKTEKALKDFQQDREIQVDGVVGPETSKAISEANSEKAPDQAGELNGAGDGAKAQAAAADGDGELNGAGDGAKAQAAAADRDGELNGAGDGAKAQAAAADRKDSAGAGKSGAGDGAAAQNAAADKKDDSAGRAAEQDAKSGGEAASGGKSV